MSMSSTETLTPPPAPVPTVGLLAGAALGPIVEITQTARKLGELRAGAQRIFTILGQRSAVADHGNAPAPGTSAIQFEHVRFSYGAGRAPVLDDVSFNVAQGETVALVGPSGVGKSTCAHLLLRFWDAASGYVRVGGVDIRNLSLTTLRRLIATVPQDIHLFNDTIAANIRLGRPDATFEEVQRAAQQAQAHEFITTLPQGYDTVCGERGARLSGGQRQRLAIARAFLCNAPILIMDEAASNLDTENERALQQVLSRLREGRTVLIIAHRPATIRSADRIVVLEDGQVAEAGTHDRLVNQGGAYARLMASLWFSDAL